MIGTGVRGVRYVESAAHIIETFLCLMSSEAAERPRRRFIGAFNQAEKLMGKAT